MDKYQEYKEYDDDCDDVYCDRYSPNLLEMMELLDVEPDNPLEKYESNMEEEYKNDFILSNENKIK
jgi:hypothetical protein